MPMLVGRARPEVRVEVPALLVWGIQDAFLGRELVQPTLEICVNGRTALLEEATHWLAHEEPDKVNALLAKFLNREDSAGR